MFRLQKRGPTRRNTAVQSFNCRGDAHNDEVARRLDCLTTTTDLAPRISLATEHKSSEWRSGFIPSRLLRAGGPAGDAGSVWTAASGSIDGMSRGDAIESDVSDTCTGNYRCTRRREHHARIGFRRLSRFDAIEAAATDRRRRRLLRAVGRAAADRRSEFQK
jgi:hypothetical protein